MGASPKSRGISTCTPVNSLADSPYYDREVGSTKVGLTELGQKLIWGDSPESKDWLVSFAHIKRNAPELISSTPQMMQQIHADIVKVVPDDFELLAYSELTPIQGIALLYDEEAQIPLYQHSHEHQLPPDPWKRVHIIAFQGEFQRNTLLPSALTISPRRSS